MPRYRKYTKEWLEELCKDSFSYAEVLRKAGRKPGGGNQTTLKMKIKEYNIDISHFTGKLWSKGKTIADDSRILGHTEDEVFCKDSKVYRQCLRSWYIRRQDIPYKCVCCGNEGEWQGQRMSLELDHINGHNDDNRFENLRWLCPNCHAITPTWRRTNE